MWQYVVVAVVVALSVAWAVRLAYREIRHSLYHKNPGCAGCAFYDKCARADKRLRNETK